jgi:hypothetical protein
MTRKSSVKPDSEEAPPKPRPWNYAQFGKSHVEEQPIPPVSDEKEDDRRPALPKYINMHVHTRTERV